MRGSTPARALIETGLNILYYFLPCLPSTTAHTGLLQNIFTTFETTDEVLMVELGWIIAFLTAKEDAPLQEFISKQLFEVENHIMIDHIFHLSLNYFVNREF